MAWRRGWAAWGLGLMVGCTATDDASGGATNEASEACPGTVELADEALASAVREALRLPPQDPIQGDHMARLGRLDAVDAGVVRLDGLECAFGLHTLVMPGNAVTDASPLEGLPRLSHVDLSDSAISDLGPFATLPDLVALDLSRNGLADVEPLAGHPALVRLTLDGNELTSTASIHDLRGLEELSLQDDPITAVVGLEGLLSLRTLNLDGTRIDDLSGLAPLTSLHELSAQRTRLTALRTIPSLPALVKLTLSNNAISDASVTAVLPELQSLNLRDNGLTGVEGLTPAVVPKLRLLMLGRNPLAGLESVAAFEGLGFLSIEQTGVSDLSQLAGLRELWSVDAPDNAIVDLTPVADMIMLDLSRNAIVDLEPLVGTWHSRLWLAGNQIVDASPLTMVDFERCAEVSLDDNPLMDQAEVIDALCDYPVNMPVLCEPAACTQHGS